MRKVLFAATLVAVAAVGSPAQAGEPTDPWKAFTDVLQANSNNIAGQIVRLENEHPSLCVEAAKKDEAKRRACIAGYRMLIASARKDAAVVEFQLAAAQTDAKSRDELLKIVRPQEFDAEGAVTKRRSDEIVEFFRKLKVAKSTTTGQR